MQKRYAKDDWIKLGFELLAQKGSQSLTIEKLCKSAGKTKGSFYFHFQTIEDYLISLVQQWYKTYTLAITSRKSSGAGRLDLLNQLVARLDFPLETAIRTLAARNSTLHSIVIKADEERMDWLASLYEASGQYSHQQAKALAAIEIAAFTGFRLIKPDMKPEESRQFYEDFLKLTNRV